ncbi:MAG: MoaD/ThiS family protein [Deltaproteobacteria bacterium]|nr:MoaD/ThiS family protein [Deltaproteobacteria bacterium]
MNENRAKSIKIKSCFAISGQNSEDLVLPEKVKTVRDLLAFIGEKIDYSFLDPQNDGIEDDLEIILNQKEIWFYSEALKTELRDGDMVEIYLLPLGGG